MSVDKLTKSYILNMLKPRKTTSNLHLKLEPYMTSPILVNPSSNHLETATRSKPQLNSWTLKKPTIFQARPILKSPAHDGRRRTLALELPARWVEGQAPKQAQPAGGTPKFYQ